jgi:hypothetical protein
MTFRLQFVTNKQTATIDPLLLTTNLSLYLQDTYKKKAPMLATGSTETN